MSQPEYNVQFLIAVLFVDEHLGLGWQQYRKWAAPRPYGGWKIVLCIPKLAWLELYESDVGPWDVAPKCWAITLTTVVDAHGIVDKVEFRTADGFNLTALRAAYQLMLSKVSEKAKGRVRSAECALKQATEDANTWDAAVSMLNLREDSPTQ